MLGKVIIYAIVAVLTALVISPPFFTYVYFLTRPLLQPFAMADMRVLGVPLTGLMALQLTGFTLLWGVLRKDFSFVVPNIMPLYLLIFFAFLSLANSLDLYASVSGFAKIVAAVLSYVLVYNIIKTEDDARKFLFVIMLATLIPMFVGYYQFFTESGGKAIGGVTNRVKGTLGLANAYGIYLALSLCATVMLLMHPRWRANKYFLGAVIASIVVSSIIALNRGTWIALSLAVVIASLFYIKRIRVRWIILAFIAVAGVFSNTIIDRFNQLGERTYYMNQDTLERRIAYWESTLKKVPEHALIGWGIGTARQVMKGRFDVSDVTHNDYLRLLLETGIFGLGAYLFFLGREGWHVFRRLRSKNLWHVNYPMLIALAYFVVISIPQNIYDHMVNLPLFFSLIAISYRLVEFEQSRNEETRWQGLKQSKQNQMTETRVRRLDTAGVLVLRPKSK